jgi:hypothetical protein
VGEAYASDGGLEINMAIKSPAIDFQRKDFVRNLVEVILSHQSSGNLTLNVITEDGTTYPYIVTHYSDADYEQRVKLGKGIRSRYITIEITATGEVVEIDAVKLLTKAVYQRRR